MEVHVNCMSTNPHEKVRIFIIATTVTRIEQIIGTFVIQIKHSYVPEPFT